MSVSGQVNPLASWTEYFLAQAGAAAALTGLLFVALSFNLDRIAADRTWLGRAGTGLIYLAQPVIVSLVALFHARTAAPASWTLTGIGITATLTLTGLDPGAGGTRTAGPAASGILNGFRRLATTLAWTTARSEKVVGLSGAMPCRPVMGRRGQRWP